MTSLTSSNGPSEFFKDLQNRYNIEMIGSVLGSGITTIAIETYFEFDFSNNKNNEVLIITKDKSKQMFYEELFSKTDIVISELDFPEETIEDDNKFSYLQRIADEESIYMFYVPLMKQLSQIDEVEKFSSEVSFLFNHESFFAGEIPLGNLDNFEVINEFHGKLLNAVKKSIFLANDIFAYGKYSLDLHIGQFLEYKGEIFCIDPVLKR